MKYTPQVSILYSMFVERRTNNPSFFYLQLYNCIESLINKLIIMEETTEKWEDVMLAKLEKQKQEFIKAYIKTYGEYPKCYVNDKGK